MDTKRGRPIKPAVDGDRHPLASRVSASLKRSLEESAHASGRSISQEVEMRLEQSFRDDRVEARLAEIEDRLSPQPTRRDRRKEEIRLQFLEKGPSVRLHRVIGIATSEYRGESARQCPLPTREDAIAVAKFGKAPFQKNRKGFAGGQYNIGETALLEVEVWLESHGLELAP